MRGDRSQKVVESRRYVSREFIRVSRSCAFDKSTFESFLSTLALLAHIRTWRDLYVLATVSTVEQTVSSAQKGDVSLTLRAEF